MTTHSSASAPSSLEELAPSAPKLLKRELVALFLAQSTLYLALVVPPAFSLAIKIGAIDPVNKDTILALCIGIGGTLILFTNPIAGVLSDRTRSRFGRRRPWFLGGMLIALAGSALVGLGNDAVTIVAGWAVAVVGYTLSTSMLLAYLGDRLPEEQRGKVMGINGAITQIGPIVGIVIAGSFASQLGLMFLIPAAIAFLGPVWFLVSMRDSQYSGALPPFRFSDLTRGFYFNPRRHTNFGWVILSKLFVYASLAFGGLYGIYLLQARLGLDTGAVATLIATVAGLGVFTAIIGAIGAGWLSDKLRSRKPFLIASGVLLVASPLIVGTTTSTLQFIVGGLVGTFAIGIYGSVDQALALDTLPSDENENGRYLAIFGLANGIPQAFGPFAAAFVLTLAGGDYSWVYYVAAAFAALGALSIIPISVGKRASLSTVSIDAVS